MNFPEVRVGDVVCITTCHNETQDDLHYGIVTAIPDTYKEDGKIGVIYIVNSWRNIQQRFFNYNPEFTGWDTWRLTDECNKVNDLRCMFTHSVPPNDFEKHRTDWRNR